MRVCAVSLFLSAFLMAPHMSTAQSEPLQRQCWTEKSLLSKPSERLIRRGGKNSRVKAPVQQSHALPPLPPELQGSIRYVKLTAGRKLVALTFDLCESAGEVAGYEGRIVEYLRQHNIKATFFVGGHWLMTHKKRAMQLTSDPLFQMGNHSWTHANMRHASSTKLKNQIHWAQAAYQETRQSIAQMNCVGDHQQRMEKIPQHMKLFRFPYGSCSPQALKAVAQSGLLAIQWNVATGDPARSQSAGRIARTVLARTKPGSIVIAHANGRGWHSAKALPLYIPKLLAKGYEFVTISELLAAGTPVISKQCYNERPGDTKYYEPRSGKRAVRNKRARVKKLVPAKYLGPWGQEHD